MALRKEGSAIVLDSKLPYLFCIDDDVLSTGMILYHLKVNHFFITQDVVHYAVQCIPITLAIHYCCFFSFINSFIHSSKSYIEHTEQHAVCHIILSLQVCLLQKSLIIVLSDCIQ